MQFPPIGSTLPVLLNNIDIFLFFSLVDDQLLVNFILYRLHPHGFGFSHSHKLFFLRFFCDTINIVSMNIGDLDCYRRVIVFY